MTLREYPSELAGTALGVANISLFWSLLSANFLWAQIILWLGFFITLMMISPILAKFIRHPSVLLADIKHPTLGSIVPTLTMASMLLSHGVGLLTQTGAVCIWLLAVIAHVCFLLIFIYFRVRQFNLNHILPSYFVPPIGIVVACLTVPAHFLMPVAQVILWFGILSYAVLLPLVIYRLSVGSDVEDARKPTLAILAAPAGLTLSGYLTVVASPEVWLVLILLILTIAMLLSVYIMLIHLLRLSYSPAYSAFTFPLAISATAFMKITEWVNTKMAFQHYVASLSVSTLVSGALATIIILLVLIHTIRYLIKQL